MSKKEKIFETALRLFVENGIDKTATAKIASEAKVATGTLFHHFKNKEDLVNALYLEVKASMADAMSRGINDIQQDKDILRHMWDNFMEWSINNPDLLKFSILVCETPIITKKTKQHLIGQTFFIKEAKASKSLRDLPFDLLAILTGSVLTRIAHYFIENPEAYKNHEIVDEAFEACFGMLTKG